MRMKGGLRDFSPSAGEDFLICWTRLWASPIDVFEVCQADPQQAHTVSIRLRKFVLPQIEHQKPQAELDCSFSMTVSLFSKYQLLLGVSQPSSKKGGIDHGKRWFLFLSRRNAF